MIQAINTTLNNVLFVSLLHHKMMVIEIDALYTKAHITKYIILGLRQTKNVLVNFNKAPWRLYMPAGAYESSQGAPIDNRKTPKIFNYNKGSSSSAILPKLLFYNDTKAITRLETNLRSLTSQEHPIKVPLNVDENFFYTIGLVLFPCPINSSWGPNGTRFAVSMKNHSLVLILQARHFGINGFFTNGIPNSPPIQFDYTKQNISRSLWAPMKITQVKVLR